jgi:acyl-CoA thioester hydrolase
MTEALLTYRGTVYPAQCDHMGHMNVMWYVGKFDEASWQVLTTLGLTPSRMRSDGLAMAAVEQHIAYKRELHAGDVVTVRTEILEVKDKVVRIAHEMRNDETGEIAATMVVVAVHLDAVSRRARSLPADVRERTLQRVKRPQGEAALEPAPVDAVLTVAIFPPFIDCVSER